MKEPNVTTLEKPIDIYSDSELFNNIANELIKLKIKSGSPLNQQDKELYHVLLLEQSDILLTIIEDSLEEVGNQLDYLRETKAKSKDNIEKDELRLKIVRLSNEEDRLFKAGDDLEAEFDKLTII